MSVAEMQACLARLYVNEPFRRLFYLDPSGALDGYRLTDEEREALGRLDRRQLDLFASALVSKRRKRVERAYPLLFAVDAAAMRRHYARFYQLYPAKPNHAPEQDIVDFGVFMEASLAMAEDVPPYASDVAKYERLYNLAVQATTSAVASDHDPSTHPRATIDARPFVWPEVHVADFTYDVAELEAALHEGGDLAEVRPAANGCSIVFRPGTNGSRVQMLRINTPTRTVLDLCDGRRSVAAIVAQTEAALRAPGLDGSILETVDRLLAAQILGLESPGAAQRSVHPQRYGGPVQVESM